MDFVIYPTSGPAYQFSHKLPKKYKSWISEEEIVATKIDHKFTVPSKEGRLLGNAGDYVAYSEKADVIFTVNSKLFDKVYRESL